MRVWIVNYYTDIPEKASNPRYVEFARHFMEYGWDVITFNASYQNDSLRQKFDNNNVLLEKKYGDYQFTHVKAPLYKGNGLMRMWSIFVFAWRVFSRAKKQPRPDVIVHNIHAPFDFPVQLAAKKLKSKYVGEVWDQWPFMFVHLGLVSKKNPMMSLFYWVEKQLYYHSDEVVFVAHGSLDYLRKKGWTSDTNGKLNMSHVHCVSCGVNLDQFNMNCRLYPRNDVDINRSDIYKIVYMGSINQTNHVNTLIDAAALLKDDERYYFFIYGDGAYRNELEQYVKEKGIRNVIFKERRIPLCEVAWVVSQATVNIMTYKKGFGILGLGPGKLYQYLAAGKPIVCNVVSAYDDVITENDLGVSKDMETPEEFVQAIRSIAEQPKNAYDAMCNRVRETAKRFDYKLLASEEIKIIESALSD